MKSSKKTLFVGNPTPIRPTLPFYKLMSHYSLIRDSIAETAHIDDYEPSVLVANASFIYAFNAYKAVSLLLPHSYHESAATVFRQLWEVSLNLHWLCRDLGKRSQDFLNFTMMEYRKLIQKTEGPESVAEFDNATRNNLNQFRFKDGKGRTRTHDNFSTKTIFERASEVGEPWKDEYSLVYHLTSMHAHGAPGAILHPIFASIYPDPDAREESKVALIAILSIKTMVRNVRLLKAVGVIPNDDSVIRLYQEFERELENTSSPTAESQ